MATENTGGWQLTTATYARGGRMESVGSDGKVISSAASSFNELASRSEEIQRSLQLAPGGLDDARFFRAGRVGDAEHRFDSFANASDEPDGDRAGQNRRAESFQQRGSGVCESTGPGSYQGRSDGSCDGAGQRD